MNQVANAVAAANPDMSSEPVALPASEVLALLKTLPEWGTVVTIVLHGGSVFEFKGPFPAGDVGRGFYNLDGPVPGFHGHLNLGAIDYVGFQEKPHAGRPAYAITFNSWQLGNVFKVFLGRDADGEIWPDQLARFESLKTRAIPLSMIKENAK